MRWLEQAKSWARNIKREVVGLYPAVASERHKPQIAEITQLTEKQVATIIAWAKRTPDVQAVILFGSRCKGTARPNSDVDLALVMTEGPDQNQRADDYLHNYKAWEAELKGRLALDVTVGLLDPPLGGQVPGGVAGCRIELWSRGD